MKNIILIAALFIITSCSGDMKWSKAAGVDYNTPEGPPEYQQGFKDGCETGRSAYSNHFYKMFLQSKQDEQLAANPVYYQIWQDAYLYCWFQQETTGSHGWGNFR